MKKLISLFLGFMMITSLTSCAKNKKGEEYPVEILETKIEAQPLSVVSLSPSLTEITYDLGFELTLDGVSDYCDLKDNDDAVKVGTMQNPKVDKIIEIKPDVLITNSELTESDATKLLQADINILVVPPVNKLEGVWGQYDVLGKLYSGKVTGVKRAKEKYEPYKEKIESLKNSDEKIKGLLIAKKDYAIATGDTLLGDLLGYINIDNIGESGKKFGVTTDKLNEAEVIFISEDIDINDINQDEKLKNSPAVKNKTVYQIDVDALLRGGFTSLDLLEEMNSLAFGDTENKENEK